MADSVITLKSERRAELDDYVRRHGQDPETALDEVLADYFASEREDFEESVEAIRRADEDIKVGRTRPASEFLEELRAKHGFPR
jgi:hypothetical protein